MHASTIRLADLVLRGLLSRRRHPWNMLWRHTQVAELPVVHGIELLLVDEAQTLEGWNIAVVETLIVVASI